MHILCFLSVRLYLMEPPPFFFFGLSKSWVQEALFPVLKNVSGSHTRQWHLPTYVQSASNMWLLRERLSSRTQRLLVRAETKQVLSGTLFLLCELC